MPSQNNQQQYNILQNHQTTTNSVKSKKIKFTIQQLALKIAHLAEKIQKKIIIFFRSEDKDGPFHSFFENFTKNLHHHLNINDLADNYVQSIACGLFAIKFAEKGDFFSYISKEIPNTLFFLKPFFRNSLQLKEDKINQIILEDIGVKELIDILRMTDIESILENFEKQKSVNDLITYFYELFLRSYNPQLKIKRGIFHTPWPIVSFIVRSVDYLLQTEFNCPDGLADTSNISNKYKDMPKVQILDPATGTGTFLEYVIRQIKSTFDKKNANLSEFLLRKKWGKYVSKHLLTRLFGFELLMAPYTIAYLKLSFILRKMGYTFTSQQNLGLFLTNTLKYRINLDQTVDFKNFSDENILMNGIKTSRQISVIIGNPPYSRSSANKGIYIKRLMDSYKQAVRDEKNIQPLSDDYIKFIRWAQEIIERTGWGIIGMITNHTYLTGIIHRGMRQELMRVFDRIYILDLHGSKITHENIPTGIKDENIFGIKQGICITFFLKNQNYKQKKIFHFNLFGSKNEKYDWLTKHDISNISWSNISNIKPGAPFKNPSDISADSRYHKYHSLTEIFEFFNVGGKPGDDKLLISFDPQKLSGKLKEVIIKARKKENLEKLTEAKQKLLHQLDKFSFDKSKIEKYNYRPFDIRWTYYDPTIWTRPVKKLKFQCKNNQLLLCSRIVKDAKFSHIFVSNLFTDVIFLSNTSSVNCYVFPLLKKQINNELSWNLSQLYINYLKRMGIDLNNMESSEPLAYLYSILFSNKYRFRYFEYLKRDFPRIPFIENQNLFKKLVKLGKKLIKIHLKPDDFKPFIEIKSNIVHGDEIKRGFPKYYDKYIYIAPKKGFYEIEKEIWNFRIGNYQVCYKWLKDRVNRFITEKEIRNYVKIIIILKETLKIMKKIDLIMEGI